MEALIWIGAGLTLVGLLGLIWCIVIAAKARREGLDDEAMKARLQKVVALNLGALAISALGLMTVVLGVFLS
ncbi:hypothetical protein GQ651_02830 [Alphaproteobacteria bacterium GH1-50]|uniref:Uncharacterized protein n=1 Tax=Kangsaoukella pontilimi TaxID=2691042 RepID=A0A7C9MVE4_9RHOB|nr:hypothetical protein [Kangsaoukella pontilimi]MXQ06774.1 hypothetical protein [Kangsaoukella pontilimi]